jgi:hypothetical protein
MNAVAATTSAHEDGSEKIYNLSGAIVWIASLRSQ